MYYALKRHPFVLTLGAALGIASLVAGLLFVSRQSAAQAAAATTVTLASPGNARPGEPVRVKLIVTGARNLAGFQTTVGYDSEAVHLLDAAAVEGLRGSGRDMLQLGPVRRANAVVFGAATCPVDDCSSVKYRSSGRKPQGVNGRVELGEIVVEVAAPGRYELRIDEVKLVDPQGNVLPAATANLTIDVK